MERQATGGTLLDKIEIDRGRPVRPIRISVRRGEYPPRFRSTRCMMFARCSAKRSCSSLYPVISRRIVGRNFSLHFLVSSSDGPNLLLGTGVNNLRSQDRTTRLTLHLLTAQFARYFATACAEGPPISTPSSTTTMNSLLCLFSRRRERFSSGLDGESAEGHR
jgi:hypothetical protein